MACRECSTLFRADEETVWRSDGAICEQCAADGYTDDGIPVINGERVEPHVIARYREQTA